MVQIATARYNFMNGESDIQQWSPRQCDASISACYGKFCNDNKGIIKLKGDKFCSRLAHLIQKRR